MIFWRRKPEPPIKDELLAELEVKDEIIEKLKEKIEELKFDLGIQKKINSVQLEKNEILIQQLNQKDIKLTHALNLLSEVKITLSNGQTI